MIRKMLFIVGAVSLVSLIAAGLTFGLPAKATTSAAATTATVQGCNFPIPISNVDLGPRRTGGGHEVTVNWGEPNDLPNCVSVEKFTVTVKIKLPNDTRQQEATVGGNVRTATLLVRGFPTDKDPQSVTATITATLKVNGAATGSKTEQVRTTP